MRKIIYFFIFSILFLNGCSDTIEQGQISFLSNGKLSSDQKFLKILDINHLKSLNLNDSEIKWIIDTYKKRGYKRFFSNDSTLFDISFDLQCELDRSIWYGIPKIRIRSINKSHHFLEKEVLLMLNFGRMISDLNQGFFDFKERKLKQDLSLIFTEKYLKEIDTISLTKLFQKQGPTDTNYRFLAYNLYHYGKSHLIDTTEFKINPLEKDKTKLFKLAKKSLLSKGWLEEDADSSTFVNALKKFQTENGLDADGRIGKNTIYSLNESTYDKMLRASLSLDRLRNLNSYPKKFVKVNIPEFMLYFYADDTLRSSHRIIVGKVENQTPQLESKIWRIVCYPFWKVPSSIANKEILPAVQLNPNYLVKNHYKVYRSKDQEINPKNINWRKYSHFPYSVIQEPGAKNSLGIIKFEFNNSYSVYVHDTPNKNLFNTVFRSYSHGCMRCDKPVELAKSILTFDSIPGKVNPFRADTLDSLLAKPGNLPIPLIEPIPIYVVYETVAAEKENLIFHLDLYRREEELVKILKGKK